MPVRFVAERECPLYSEQFSEDILEMLPLGARVEVDGRVEVRHGRLPARHADRSGFVEVSKLTASSAVVLAASRRVGVELPGLAPPLADEPCRPVPERVTSAAAKAEDGVRRQGNRRRLVQSMTSRERHEEAKEGDFERIIARILMMSLVVVLLLGLGVRVDKDPILNVVILSVAVIAAFWLIEGLAVRYVVGIRR